MHRVTKATIGAGASLVTLGVGYSLELWTVHQGSQQILQCAESFAGNAVLQAECVKTAKEDYSPSNLLSVLELVGIVGVVVCGGYGVSAVYSSES